MLHGRATRLALVLLSTLAGTACSTLRGTPERYQSAESIVASIDLTADDVAALAVADNQSERNRLQNKALAVIDLRFNEFVRALAADRADSSATAAGTTLGASTAGAFVDGVKAKTNYALFAAGVVGAFGIVDKNYFYEKTVPALVAGMRAARAKVLLRMRQGQMEALAHYNGVAALQDLEDYYTAGTVLAAIAEVTARAEDDAAQALGQVRALEVPSDAEIAHRKTLSQAIFGIQDEAAMAKGNAALKVLGLPEQATPKATRAALVRALQPRTPERVATVERALKAAGLLQ
jgi:DnaJ-domain-containing protein 1